MCGDGRRQDFGRCALSAIYKCYIIKLLTWKLHNVIDQCYTNKFNFEKIREEEVVKNSRELVSELLRCFMWYQPTKSITCPLTKITDLREKVGKTYPFPIATK